MPITRSMRVGGMPEPVHAPPEVAVDPFRTLEAEAGAVIRSAARRALRPVIDELSPRGLLESSAEEIARRHGLSVPDVTAAIEAVRAVGPPGITAPDLTTMLVTQARFSPRPGRHPRGSRPSCRTTWPRSPRAISTARHWPSG